jgi:hypothetical protein
LSEILKSLWTKIYAWAFPSALTFGAYFIFVYPKSTLAHQWLDGATEAQKVSIFVAVTAATAFILNAFSAPLYRILEGYLLWPSCLQNLREERQLRRKRQLESSLPKDGWRRGLGLEKLALYPKNDTQIVPTRFGNAIRSFETYGKTRFNLDTQTLWYELYSVVPKYLQTEYTDARSTVDFFVAFIYLSFALGIATLLIAVDEKFDPSLLIIGVVSLVVAVACHWLAVRATREWSYTVQALVNIGREKLADGLGLELPNSIEKEKEMWGLVTKYTYYAEEIDARRLDQFRKRLVAPCTAAPVNPEVNDGDGDSDGNSNDTTPDSSES